MNYGPKTGPAPMPSPAQNGPFAVAGNRAAVRYGRLIAQQGEQADRSEAAGRSGRPSGHRLGLRLHYVFHGQPR